MLSLRRFPLISRRDNNSNTDYCPRHFGQPRVVTIERIRPRRCAEEFCNEDPPLPPYTPSTDPYFNQPPSPPPSYSTVDVSDYQPLRRTQAAPPSPRSRKQRIFESQIIVDQLARRISESLKKPNAWRTLSNGEKCFFWALRCDAGAADIISENLDLIRNRVLLSPDWRVEKFCMLFKGQKLVDLWCRPIQTKVPSFSNDSNLTGTRISL
jgi:hypothetical protein